ncbi:MAG: hypothetical protein KF814_18645 [Nitrospiraceae bacterium]|nr:hypothetical protein [Nitrospiraceae bacterium]
MRTPSIQKPRPADFSCPDCVGVLSVEMTNGRRRGYVCQVGHRFSTRSLLLAKEKELERTLWAAAVLLLQTATVHEQFFDEQQWSVETRKALRRRIREATHQFHTLVHMIELTHGAQ